jgi:hypothetical protein
LESLVPKKKKRGQLRIGMNIINRLEEVAWSVPCGGSAELADGIFSMVSSVVGPWDTMADGVPCVGGLTACSVAPADYGWLGGAGSAVGIDTDFYHFGCALASVKALRFTWASAMVGLGASALAGCEGWTSGTLVDVPICCCKTGVRYDI